MKIKDYEHYLKLTHRNINWCTNNNNILKLNADKHSIAHELGYRSLLTRWACSDNILILKNKNNCSVAYFLAEYAGTTKWQTNNPLILKLRGYDNLSVKEKLIEQWLDLRMKNHYNINNKKERYGN